MPSKSPVQSAYICRACQKRLQQQCGASNTRTHSSTVPNLSFSRGLSRPSTRSTFQPTWLPQQKRQYSQSSRSQAIGPGRWLRDQNRQDWKRPNDDWLLEKQSLQSRLARKKQETKDSRLDIVEPRLNIPRSPKTFTSTLTGDERQARLDDLDREDAAKLGIYGATIPPTPEQLKHASRYFCTAPPNFLMGNAQFKTLPQSDFPEVAFLGRSNVGKSSLLNALFGRSQDNPVAYISSRPGKTREMNAFGVGGVELRRGKEEARNTSTGTESVKAHDRWISSGNNRSDLGGGLVVIDMPGYGQASRQEWGTQITKYLSQRKQLRRAFVLVHQKHGLKDSDRQVLEMLRQNGVPHQVILTKADMSLPRKNSWEKWRAWETAAGGVPWAQVLMRAEEIQKEVSQGGALGDVLLTSAEMKVDEPDVRIPAISKDALGVNRLRYAVLQACGMESDEKGKKKMNYGYPVQGQ